MAGLRKALPPHPITCIKRALVDCLKRAPSAQTGYGIVRDREDCADCEEFIENYLGLVNVTDGGQVILQNYDDSSCSYKARLTVVLQAYAKGCADECATVRDVAMGILAELESQLLTRCIGCGVEGGIEVNEIEPVGIAGTDDQGRSKEFSRVDSTYFLTYTFDPHKPNVLKKDQPPEKSDDKLWYE